MKKYILGILFIIFTLTIISSTYATSVRSNGQNSVKKCISYYADDCLRYSYTYEYQCIHYNQNDCSWRKVKFIDKCIIFRKNMCKRY